MSGADRKCPELSPLSPAGPHGTLASSGARPVASPAVCPPLDPPIAPRTLTTSQRSASCYPAETAIPLPARKRPSIRQTSMNSGSKLWIGLKKAAKSGNGAALKPATAAPMIYSARSGNSCWPPRSPRNVRRTYARHVHPVVPPARHPSRRCAMTTATQHGSPQFPAAVSPSAASDQAALDAAVRDLQAHKDAWVAVSVRERIALVDRLIHDYLAITDRWVAACLAAKGIAPGSPIAGEEWGAGPY